MGDGSTCFLLLFRYSRRFGDRTEAEGAYAARRNGGHGVPDATESKADLKMYKLQIGDEGTINALR